jgi:hypothetical protein
LTDPVFAFALELITGRVAGFELYKVQKGIDFYHDIQPSDFPVTDALYKELRKFVASNPMYKTTADQLDRSRPFVERQLRYDLITAAFGSVTALQVLNQEDPQIAQAVDAMPRARELAIAARRARARS